MSGGTIDLAEELLANSRIPRPEPSGAAVWSELRQLAFGLADGGDLPDGYEEPVDAANRLLVITDAWSSASLSTSEPRSGGRVPARGGRRGGWSAGHCTAVPAPGGGTYPATAQHAQREGVISTIVSSARMSRESGHAGGCSPRSSRSGPVRR
jgi:hypothetical protein